MVATGKIRPEKHLQLLLSTHHHVLVHHQKTIVHLDSSQDCFCQGMLGDRFEGFSARNVGPLSAMRNEYNRLELWRTVWNWSLFECSMLKFPSLFAALFLSIGLAYMWKKKRTNVQLSNSKTVHLIRRPTFMLSDNPIQMIIISCLGCFPWSACVACVFPRFPTHSYPTPQIFQMVQSPVPSSQFSVLSSHSPSHISSTNPQNLGSNPNAKRMAEVVSFYKKLPTGPAPAAKKPVTPWGKYKAAYFDGENASGKPLVHLAVLIILFGYTWEYQSHLKHHKH